VLLGKVFSVDDARGRRKNAHLKQQLQQECSDKVGVLLLRAAVIAGRRQVDPIPREKRRSHYCGVGKVWLA